VLWIAFHHLLHQIKLLQRHGLDDKLLVVAEEEKAAWPSRAFASFKDHVPVELGT
jgi:hypothetical protein